MKYTLEFKLECIDKYKKSMRLPFPDGINQCTFRNHVKEWVQKYDDLGVDGLIHKSFQKDRTPEERFELVAKILAGNSYKSVAKQNHVSEQQLYLWIRKYNENGMDGLQCKKGRKPKIPIMSKKKTNKLSKSEKEELILLREKNKLLEMENEYLKKLDALVSQREAAEAKAKK